MSLHLYRKRSPANGGKRAGAGRPATGRVRVPIRLTRAEKERLDLLRKGQPFGVYLGKLIMAQPVSPFAKFLQIQKPR